MLFCDPNNLDVKVSPMHSNRAIHADTDDLQTDNIYAEK